MARATSKRKWPWRVIGHDQRMAFRSFTRLGQRRFALRLLKPKERAAWDALRNHPVLHNRHLAGGYVQAIVNDDFDHWARSVLLAVERE